MISALIPTDQLVRTNLKQGAVLVDLTSRAAGSGPLLDGYCSAPKGSWTNAYAKWMEAGA